MSPDNPITCNGQVTKWTYHQGPYSQPFKAIVARRISDTDFKIVGYNEIPVSETNRSTVVYTVPREDRFTVSSGDVIGWSFPGTHGAITFQDGDTEVRFADNNITEGNLYDTLYVDNTVTFEYAALRNYSIEVTVAGKN